jgi:hypothetical protein
VERALQLKDVPALSFDAGVDAEKTWRTQLFINNDRVFSELADSKDLAKDSADRCWKLIDLDLAKYRNQQIVSRPMTSSSSRITTLATPIGRILKSNRLFSTDIGLTVSHFLDVLR